MTAKELFSVSIQQDRTRPAVPAVNANQSTEGNPRSDRWLPIWALALMYPVFIGLAIVFGIVFFGSH
jgi:hypothetical protein